MSVSRCPRANSWVEPIGIVSLALPPTLWVLLQLSAFALLDVPGHFPWYLYPLWMWVACLSALSLEVLFFLVRELLRRAGAGDDTPLPRQSVVASMTWLVLLGVSLAAFEIHRIDRAELEKPRAYRDISELILAITEPHERLMLSEIGIMGYLTGRTVVDTHGLIHAQLPEDDVLVFERLVARFRPELIVDEGWVFTKPPDFRERVLAGSLSREFALADGSVLRYEQVAHGRHEGAFLPVLLRLVGPTGLDVP